MNDNAYCIKGECSYPQIHQQRRGWMRYTDLCLQASVVHWQGQEREGRSDSISVCNVTTRCHCFFLKYQHLTHFTFRSPQNCPKLKTLSKCSKLQTGIMNFISPLVNLYICFWQISIRDGNVSARRSQTSCSLESPLNLCLYLYCSSADGKCRWPQKASTSGSQRWVLNLWVFWCECRMCELDVCLCVWVRFCPWITTSPWGPTLWWHWTSTRTVRRLPPSSPAASSTRSEN